MIHNAKIGCTTELHFKDNFELFWNSFAKNKHTPLEYETVFVFAITIVAEG